jgi:hypothetical protein
MLAAVVTIIAFIILKVIIGRDLAILLILGVLACYCLISKHVISLAMKVIICFLLLILGWFWLLIVLAIYGVYKLVTR